jgi:hypothetical protein
MMLGYLKEVRNDLYWEEEDDSKQAPVHYSCKRWSRTTICPVF